MCRVSLLVCSVYIVMGYVLVWRCNWCKLLVHINNIFCYVLLIIECLYCSDFCWTSNNLYMEWKLMFDLTCMLVNGPLVCFMSVVELCHASTDDLLSVCNVFYVTMKLATETAIYDVTIHRICYRFLCCCKNCIKLNKQTHLTIEIAVWMHPWLDGYECARCFIGFYWMGVFLSSFMGLTAMWLVTILVNTLQRYSK